MPLSNCPQFQKALSCNRQHLTFTFMVAHTQIPLLANKVLLPYQKPFDNLMGIAFLLLRPCAFHQNLKQHILNSHQIGSCLPKSYIQVRCSKVLNIIVCLKYILITIRFYHFMGKPHSINKSCL